MFAVNDEFLHKQCNVAKFGARAAVLRCIDQLRKRSERFKSHEDTMIFEASPPNDDRMPLDEEQAAPGVQRSAEVDQSAQSVAELSIPRERLLELLAAQDAQAAPNLQEPAVTGEPMQLDDVHPAAAPSSAPNIGENPRSQETLIQDQDGRKRRRLELRPTTQDPPTAQEPVSGCDPADRHLYLPVSKQPVDNVFFGDTPVGSECAPVQISDPRITSTGRGSKQFKFIGSDFLIPSGVAQYIDSQWRRFIYTREETSLRRRGMAASARFPYRVNLQAEKAANAPEYDRRGRILFGGLRSAVVIQQDVSASSHAAQINTIATDSSDDEDSEENALVAIREDEAFLKSDAHKLGFSAEQIAELDGPFGHLLLRYQPTDDTEEDGTDRESSESVDEEMTESGDDMAEVEAEEKHMDVPEVKQIIQDVIAKYITSWMEHKLPVLESKSAWTTWRKTKRSKLVRDQLVRGAQDTITNLEKRLNMFLEDMEHAKWDDKAMLERQCESLQVTIEDIQVEAWKIDVWQRRKEPEHTSTRKSTHKHTASTSAQQGPNELQEALRHMGPGDRLSVSPQVRSSPPPADLASGNARDSDISGEHFHAPAGSPGPQADHDAFVVPDDDDDYEPEQAAPGDPQPADAPEITMQDDAHGLPSDRRQNDVHYTPSGQSKIVTLKTPTSSARFKGPVLPSSSPQAQAGSEKRPIDVSDSSPSKPETPKPKSVKKQKANHETPRQNEKKEVIRTSEADRWSFEDLVEEDDRDRILQKHLRNIGDEKRNSIWNTYQKLKSAKFKSQLMVAQVVLREPDPEATPHQISNPRGETMKLCARLLLSWWFARPDAVHEDIVPKDILDQPQVADTSVMIFADKLINFLKQKSTALYSGHKQTSLENPEIIGDTDDEPETPADLGPKPPPSISSRRRRPVKLDKAAESRQNAAKARHLKSQLQQSSNPAALHGMASFGSSQGECEINVLREPDQDAIFLRGKLAEQIKPYQLDGIQSMWRELTASLQTGKGSLLAHTMGLGKTMQSIALLTCVDNASKSLSANIRNQLPNALQLEGARKGRTLRFLVICPPPLIQNWFREIQEWTTQHTVYTVESSATHLDKVAQIKQWSKMGGVLLIGYPLFRQYVLRKAEDFAEGMRDDIKAVQQILVKDTDLVIADEAHYIKNTESSTNKALSEIESLARVALSGTPMSNDVDEIYALVSWVDPGYLSDKKQFSSFYGIPIKDGLYADSSPQEKRHSTIKLRGLHSAIAPKVNRADISVLKGSLKPKVEFVLTIELTELQRQIYAMTVAALLGTEDDLDATALTRIFSWLAVLGHLTAHPRIYRRKLLTPPAKPKKRKSIQAKAAQIDDAAQVNEDEASPAETEHAEGSPEVPGDESAYALGFTESIVNMLLADVSEDLDPTLSAKTRLLQQILQHSKACDDKVLVFSCHIPTLDYLRDLFRRDGIRFRRITGAVPVSTRNDILAEFQNGDVDVMLISTRAGGQGLNIQQANRVVIFDFGFNPAWEEQAIGRAYRLGQTKPVFVYRFVAGGTFESNIYNTQMYKTTLMKRVVDKKNTQRQAKRNTKEYLYPPKPIPHEDVSNELELDLDPHVMSKILQDQVNRGAEKDPSIDICAVRTMEVLQAEAADEPLNEEELRMVEQNTVAWNTINSGGHSVYAAASALARANGVPSSTAPVTVLPSITRPGGGPSSTQARAQMNPSATQATSNAHPTNTNLAPRDIRNQAANRLSPPFRATGMGYGGLPFPRHDGAD
ncbi:hypothetical protein Q7P37_005106 [Cladosporium fusiforme]